jgi:hypothetical protein
LHDLDDASARRRTTPEPSEARTSIQGTSSSGTRITPQSPDDYVKTFNVLNALPCDIFLGAHGAYFGLAAKYEKMKAGAANAFIDPAGYKAYVAERNDPFRKELARQQASAQKQ